MGVSQWTEMPKVLYEEIMCELSPDKMTTNGKLVDLVRQFMILPRDTRREYSISVGTSEYGVPEIEDLAREFGVEEN